MSIPRLFVSSALQQLKEKKDLWPIAFTCVLQTSFGILALWRGVWKTDTSYNRWGNPRPWDHVDPTKPNMLYCNKRMRRELFNRDPALEGLSKEIYDYNDFLVKTGFSAQKERNRHH